MFGAGFALPGQNLFRTDNDGRRPAAINIVGEIRVNPLSEFVKLEVGERAKKISNRYPLTPNLYLFDHNCKHF